MDGAFARTQSAAFFVDSSSPARSWKIEVDTMAPPPASIQ